MKIWHLTPDAGRYPLSVFAGETVRTEIGSWRVQPGETVHVAYEVQHADASDTEGGRNDAARRFNRDENSYWEASLGPFLEGDRDVCRVHGRSASAVAESPTYEFKVGPKIHLALLWHQHQPLYKDESPASGGLTRDVPVSPGFGFTRFATTIRCRNWLRRIRTSISQSFHPILPLVADTARATIDRDGAGLPERFSRPDDAEAQVAEAVDRYVRWFGRKPRGMWPAEGAVAQFVVPYFANAGIRWIASDQAVLQHSGRFGYRVENADVLCRPYRAAENESSLSIFFRSTALSDSIGFRYHRYADYQQAAKDFVNQIKHGFSDHLSSEGGRILTVILDGENAWSDYKEDARPFLHALYGLLYHLFTASWIDEYGSAPGPDLGTWIGEGAATMLTFRRPFERCGDFYSRVEISSEEITPLQNVSRSAATAPCGE